MNIDVDLLVRDYAEHIDSLSTPVDIDELLERRAAPIVRRPRTQLTPRRGVAVGLAAFAVVLVGVGIASVFRTVAAVPEDVADSEVAAPVDAYTIEPFLVGLEGLDNHFSLVLDPSGSLIVLGSDGGIRVEILPDGTAGDPAAIFDRLEDNDGLAVDGNGVVYFGLGRSLMAIAPGSGIGRWTDAPLARLQSVFAVAIDDAQDVLYVADIRDEDRDEDNSHIRIVRIDLFDDGTVGTVTEVAKVPTDGYGGNIEVGPTGELFVLNNVGEVWVVTFGDVGSASVQMLATIPAHDDEGLTSRSHWGSLAFNAHGTLYVGTSEGTVWSVEPTGESKVVATGFGVIQSLDFDTTGTLYLMAGRDVLKVTGLE